MDADDYLQLSGLQHFAFCRRQWALIHIERVWTENARTADGRVMHERAHSGASELRGDTLTVRSLKISSHTLGLSGECDIVEFHRGDGGVPLSGREGLWHAYPVEYKRGKTKLNDCDRMQLCAQAMCLEEMLRCDVPEGALFYGEPRRRELVAFTSALRAEVTQAACEMREMFDRRHTPSVKTSAKCKACSISGECLPVLMKKRSVDEYLRGALGDA
jgi:CRISPR-associated exonuclease Cas4